MFNCLRNNKDVKQRNTDVHYDANIGVIPDIRYNFGDEMTRRKKSFIKISFTIISLCSTYSSISI